MATVYRNYLTAISVVCFFASACGRSTTPPLAQKSVAAAPTGSADTAGSAAAAALPMPAAATVLAAAPLPNAATATADRQAALRGPDLAARLLAAQSIRYATDSDDDICRAQWAAHDSVLSLATPEPIAQAFLKIDNMQAGKVLFPCPVDGRSTPSYDFAVVENALPETPTLVEGDRPGALPKISPPVLPAKLRQPFAAILKGHAKLLRDCGQSYSDDGDEEGGAEPSRPECMARAQELLSGLKAQPQLAAFVYLDLLKDAEAPSFLGDDVMLEVLGADRLSGSSAFAVGLRGVADPGLMVQGLVAALQRQAKAAKDEWAWEEGHGHVQRLSWFTSQYLCGPSPHGSADGQPCAAAWTRWYLAHRDQKPEQWRTDGRLVSLANLRSQNKVHRFYAAQILLRSPEPDDVVRAYWCVRDLLLTSDPDDLDFYNDILSLIDQVPLRKVLFPSPIDGRAPIDLVAGKP